MGCRQADRGIVGEDGMKREREYQGNFFEGVFSFFVCGCNQHLCDSTNPDAQLPLFLSQKPGEGRVALSQEWFIEGL